MFTTARLTILIIFLITSNIHSQALYKYMMHNDSFSVYEVMEEAERFFSTRDKGKGSGWKGYQRWKHNTESRFFPSGDRINHNPYQAQIAFQQFLENTSTQKTTSTLNWVDLGPHDANNITSHYSPGIGRVECFIVNRSNTQEFFIGSRSGGFWKTVNGGTTWENTTDFLMAAGVNTMDVSPLSMDTILINVRNSNNGTSQGIYRSADRGNTWQATTFNWTTLGWGGLGSNGKIYKIHYHPSMPGHIFIGTNQGLYRSSDNLNTWVQLLPNADVIDIEFHPTNPNIVYVYENYYWGSNRNKVLRSTDGGFTFTASADLTNNNNAKGKIAVTPYNPSLVYFASSNGVWRSDDEGLTFTFLSNPSNSCDGFAVSDQDSLHMVYGYLDAENSTDGGYTFNQITNWANSNPDSTYVHADLRTVECFDGVFYTGTDGYFARSYNNGYHWERLNDGTGIREFYKIGISQSNPKIHMAGSQDNGTSILNETGWVEWNGGDGMEAIIHPLNENWMMGSWQFGTRQATKDGGLTRFSVNSPMLGAGDWIAPLAIDPDDHMRVFHFVDSIYVSDEFGNGWYGAGSPSFSSNIKTAAVAPSNGQVIAVAQNNLFEITTDGGTTWTDISTGLPSSSIKDIAFDPNDDQTLLVVYNTYQNNNQKIFISTDQGANWTNITHNLGNMPIQCVIVGPTSDRYIYVGAEIGVYYKSMQGSMWHYYGNGLPRTTIRELEIQEGANLLKAATWGRGLWEYPLVGREAHPVFSHTQITDTPDELHPREGNPQTITSRISYDGILNSVYAKWSTQTGSLDSTILFTNISDSTWASNVPLPLYPAGTKLYFKVYAVGSNADTTATFRFMYKVRPFDYCPSSGNLSYATAITEVECNNILKSTGKTQGYNDYTTDTIYLDIGNTYNLSVNLNTDGNYMIYAKAWIDWNKDGVFSTSDEEYDLGSSQNTFNGPTSLSPLNFMVPPIAFIGTTRMRVACKYNSAPTPCMTNQDGEVEDYSIHSQLISETRSVNKVLPIHIFPNPTRDDVFIHLKKSYSEAIVQIFTVEGKLLDQNTYRNQTIINKRLPEGSNPYILRVTCPEQSYSTIIFKK